MWFPNPNSDIISSNGDAGFADFLLSNDIEQIIGMIPFVEDKEDNDERYSDINPMGRLFGFFAGTILRDM